MTAHRFALRVREAWPRLRAALLPVHCLAIALAAIPSMSRTRPIAATDPQFASELHPWARLFGVSDEVFARDAERLRANWIEVHDRLIGPFERYLALLGAQQPWGMFSSPNRSPSRFLLEVWEPRAAPTNEAVSQDDWRSLSGLPAGAWRASFFESERTRSLLNNIARNDLWSLADQFCLYVAREAFQEDPSAEQARCTFVSEPASPPPWRARAVAVSTLVPHVDYLRVVKRDR